MIQPLRPGPSGRSASPSAFARCSGDSRSCPEMSPNDAAPPGTLPPRRAVAAGQRVEDRDRPIGLAGVDALADAVPGVVGDRPRARDDLRRLGKLVRRDTADLGDTLGRKRRRGLGEHIERGAAVDRPAQRLHLDIAAQLRSGTGHRAQTPRAASKASNAPVALSREYRTSARPPRFDIALAQEAAGVGTHQQARVGPTRSECLIEATARNEQMRQPERDGLVGAGPDAQPLRRALGQHGRPRIDDDHARAALQALLDLSRAREPRR